MVCGFFGHSDTPSVVYSQLCNIVENLIVSRGVSQFLVGTHGSFDSMVLKTLRQMKKKYPYILYHVVLAYMPTEKRENALYQDIETLLPEGIETVPKRFAISWRNQWMIRQADMIVCYITHSWGGAAQFVEYAKNKNREIIRINLR